MQQNLKILEQDNWESHWERYAVSASLNPAQTYRHETVIRLLEMKTVEPPSNLLDIGSGQGDFMSKAVQKWPNANVCGFEMSQTGVEITRKKLPSCDAFVTNLFNPPEDLKRFYEWATHAVCLEVLEHLDDPSLFLKCCCKYLKPGATLIATVPGGPMSAYDRHIGHRQHFDYKKLKKCFHGTGFNLTENYRAGFPFFNFYRLMVITLGKRLVNNNSIHKNEGAGSKIAQRVMQAYGFLFRMNRLDFPLGWQMIVIANKC